MIARSRRPVHLVVTRDVVAMRMGRQRRQAVSLPGMAGESAGEELIGHPAHGEERAGCRGAGADQHCPCVFAQQERERHFVFDRHVPPRGERVLVVGVDLDVRIDVVLGRR
ncbi:hypothetical protein ACFFMN_43265 [Planobispora siamensis]|uniref:Uncharacterized protein n=1 Tax=Planobispora siamensis TaxID=936338 RepID=A0A8J3SRN4_9ACTN|nr:hypothetical protein [Planobispora siamensis]GIH97632.1 hypothetical protein Psi01_82620 [Planobispora siamensis]